MKKRLFSIMMVVLLTVSLMACGGTENNVSTPVAEDTKTPVENDKEDAEDKEDKEDKEGGYKLLLSNAYYTAAYCAAYNPAAIAKAKELGCTLEILDGNGNQQTQLEHANLAIAEKYDGFLYFPADVDGALPVIETLNESKIPWVGVNAYTGDKIDEVGMTYYVGPDAASHGETISNTILELFPKGCSYVTIAGTAGHMQTVEIDKAVDTKLDKSKYVSIDYQNADFAAETAMSKMSDMLTAYGVASKGGKIECILVEDGGMTTGVISALEAAGYKPGDVAIVACGSNKILYDAMTDGWLSATSTQDPATEAALAVQTLYDAIQGKAKKGWTKLPTPVAFPDTKDNFNWF